MEPAAAGPGWPAATQARDEVDAPPRVGAAGRVDPGRPRLLALAIATVDLERAAPALGGLRGRLPDDDLLGARVAAAGMSPILLAEPRAEGRLAATLARHGEGPAALYVAVAPAALRDLGTMLARRGERLRDAGGPFGRQALAPVGQRWGPFLLLVGDAAAGGGPPIAGASATIAP